VFSRCGNIPQTGDALLRLLKWFGGYLRLIVVSEDLFYLEKKRGHLTAWLSRFNTAKDIVPDVQKSLETTNWEIEALENRPKIPGDLLPDGLGSILERDYRFTAGAIPMMPSYNPVLSSTASSMAISGSVSVYDYVAGFADLGSPQATEYSQTYTQRYQQLQAAQQRPEEVNWKMAKFCSQNTLDRFNTAKNDYLSAKCGAVPRRQVALGIRNLLDGLKGELFQMARLTPNENMTWERMAQRLCKGSTAGAEEQELVRHNEVRSTIMSHLSDILKDREPSSKTDLDHLWTETLDHIYAVLGLIKFK
jgi:hypothetical protein